MKVILENAFELAVKMFSETEKELLLGERSKLKQVKTDKDFYGENKEGMKEVAPEILRLKKE